MVDGVFKTSDSRQKPTEAYRTIFKIRGDGRGKILPARQGHTARWNNKSAVGKCILHYVLDLWFEKEIKEKAKGYVQLIRYADDFEVCFQVEKEAEAFGERLRERMDKFGLKIAEDKSKIIEFGRYRWAKAKEEGRNLATFDFLGFTHYCDKTRKGKFKLGRKTAKSKFKQKAKEMNQWLKSVRNQVKMKEW